VLENGPIDWRSMRSTGKIREAIAKVIPGFEKLATIDQTKEEFQISGRTFHQPRFPLEGGRAKFHVHKLPELRGSAAENAFRDSAVGDALGGVPQLRLMTVRSEGQFNTVVYEDEDLYRGQERRDVILLHPDDMQRLNLTENQRVTVRSETGQLDNILARPFPEIRAGNALMYYPEANVLVPRYADPQSRTPSFKSIVVTVEAKVAAEARA
jgi:anaerobic selenocysteine-containing dehydrogenase